MGGMYVLGLMGSVDLCPFMLPILLIAFLLLLLYLTIEPVVLFILPPDFPCNLVIAKSHPPARFPVAHQLELDLFAQLLTGHRHKTQSEKRQLTLHECTGQILLPQTQIAMASSRFHDREQNNNKKRKPLDLFSFSRACVSSWLLAYERTTSSRNLCLSLSASVPIDWFCSCCLHAKGLSQEVLSASTLVNCECTFEDLFLSAIVTQSSVTKTKSCPAPRTQAQRETE